MRCTLNTVFKMLDIHGRDLDGFFAILEMRLNNQDPVFCKIYEKSKNEGFQLVNIV